MKPKFLAAAAMAAAVSLTALPAAAEHDRRGDRDWRGERSWRDDRPAEITVRTPSGSFTVERGDRLYYRLTGNPYKFKDGRVYTYEDCYRGRCDVTVYDPYGRQRYDRVTAPPVDWALGRGGRWR